jgi:hypothetical protein
MRLRFFQLFIVFAFLAMIVQSSTGTTQKVTEAGFFDTIKEKILGRLTEPIDLIAVLVSISAFVMTVLATAYKAISGLLKEGKLPELEQGAQDEEKGDTLMSKLLKISLGIFSLCLMFFLVRGLLPFLFLGLLGLSGLFCVIIFLCGGFP